MTDKKPCKNPNMRRVNNLTQARDPLTGKYMKDPAKAKAAAPSATKAAAPSATKGAAMVTPLLIVAILAILPVLSSHAVQGSEMIGSRAVSLVASSLVGEQQRGFATLKDISIRLKSVKNIQKITKSMKMVSAAKYAKAERDLKGARSYGLGAKAFYDNIEGTPEEGKAPAPKDKEVLVLITSDRGLCGAVHTSIAKETKKIMAAKPEGQEMKIVCVGDKSRGALQRFFAANFLACGNEIGRAPPTFEDAAIVAQAVLDSGYEFQKGTILYNYFKTVVSYETRRLTILPLEAIKAQENLTTYDSVDDDVLQSYSEYSLAQLIYYGMKESATSEQSSRMTAMDGASKNAGEMIDKLTMAFNRTRQAVITRELIEIISGAAAV